VSEDIERKVVEIVCKQLDVDQEKIKPETSFINDLGADSLDVVELVMEFEEAFNLSIPDEDAEKIRTVGDVIEYIKKNQA
jgi:acyl carrier protein